MSTVPPHHAEMKLSAGGEISLGERLDKPGEKFYSTEELVERELDEGVGVELYYNTDKQFAEHIGIVLGISAIHIENPETGRFFHSRNNAYLSWEQLEQLRDFCNFLLLLPRGAA